LDLLGAVFDTRQIVHEQRMRALLLDDERTNLRGAFDAAVHA